MNRFILWVLTTMVAGLAVAGACMAQAVPASTRREHDERTAQALKKILPGLDTDSWEFVPAQQKPLAWSLDEDINDRSANGAVESTDNPFPELDTVMTEAGFRRLSETDTTFHRKLEKIIVFGKLTASGGVELTLAAVQYADGSYSAKLGGLGVIEFAELGQLGAPTFGVVVAVYARASKAFVAERIR